MNNKRSYLDTLNEGRQRRPYASLEELNRSLENLEARLERTRDEVAEPYRPSLRQAPAAGYTPRGEYGRSAPFERPYHAIVRDIDRVRGQEDGIAAIGQIAGELRALREDMRHQMSADLQREFELLRHDIERASQAGAAGAEGAELGLELERLSGAIHSLAERSDDKSVNMLRLELEQMRNSLSDLAREETILSVDRRWTDFADRLSAAAEPRGEDPAIAALADRLEQINDAVNNLPESLSLRSIEDKVRTLAGAVDQFVRQRDSHSDEMFGLIDERLDEISRAIVASTVAAQTPHFDPEPFERIEARIAALAVQIEEVTADQPTAEIIDRLSTLAQRVDDIAARTDIPEQAVARLGQQISLIADRIEQAPAASDAGLIFQGIEQRFDALADVLERRQGDALEHGTALFRDLERRLEDLTERLDRQSAQPAADHSGIMEAIDARFTAFAQRLETNRTDPAAEQAMRALEARLEDISGRLETSAAQVSSIDPGLIRSLEAQVSELTAHLAQPGAPLPEFEDIRPRLDEVERFVAGNHQELVEAARQAAENAVRSFVGSNTEAVAVEGLAEDLKALEALTRRSDERNGKTFEAIHDTLLKIVDRLGSLETSGPVAAEAPPASVAELLTAPIADPEPVRAVLETPSLDPEEPAPLPEADATFGRRSADHAASDDRHSRSPAQAAAEAAAAVAALSGAHTDKKEPKPARSSMFGGIARAFARKGKEQPAKPELAEPVMEAAAAPSLDLDAPLDAPLDPKIANRPLEPGSGAPDLNAIMRRVRDERGQQPRVNETDAAKADFIAAARRAAQAAAAEADALKRNSNFKGPVRALRIGDLVKARRKSVLMAVGAVMLALTGIQLGKAFLSDPVQSASVTPQPSDEPTQVAAVTPKALDSAAAPVRSVDKPEIAQTASAEPQSAADATVAVALDNRITNSIPAAPVVTQAITPATAASAATSMPEAIGPAALREAANAGDAKALFEIGSRYAEGRSVAADIEAAAHWYERAAELGFAPAQYRIGNMYEKGNGVARDVAKAKTWYQLAAAQGNASAMHNLAVLFAMGADGTVDNDQATRWFNNAAELGVKDSQFNLGILAAKGVGMQQNLEESYKWFALVAMQGDNDAAAKRDEIAKALAPEQLKRARATTELWQAKALDPAANSIELPAAWQDAPAAGIDMKRAVQNVQAILNKNGYDAGKPDGMLGQKTKDAIAAFQRDNAMAPTGEIDEVLAQALVARK